MLPFCINTLFISILPSNKCFLISQNNFDEHFESFLTRRSEEIKIYFLFPFLFLLFVPPPAFCCCENWLLNQGT